MANRNQPQYSGAQGAAAGYAAGRAGYGSGFGPMSPSQRYTAAAAVRGGFNDYGAYGQGWYGDHPGAWACAGWRAGAAWTPATWGAVGAWCSVPPQQAPVYYDYGSNVTYQDNSVNVDGQSAGSPEQYYQQASDLAQAGTKAEAPADGDWLPLGVFSLCKSDAPSANLLLQLALNKQGVVRGNYTDSKTNKTQPVHGSLDKQTQRVALTIGNNTSTVIETGLYNLTKDEAPALMHFGADRTEQWLLVRQKNPDAPPQ